jgi:hypothetical protein
MAIPHRSFPARRRLAGALLLITLPAVTPAWSAAPDIPPPAARFALRQAQLEVQPQRHGRFRIDARFAPVASAGELRDGAGFTLIGRIAKAGVGCDINALFRNGFEGN